MPRLPIPGSDEGTWGDVLNDYLRAAHNTDGSLKNNTVSAAKIQDASISEAKLDTALAAKVNSVAGDPTLGGDLSGTASNAQITAGAVSSTELASNAVTTAKITDANVTTAKIADANVTTAKIADTNVTAAKLASNSVTVAKIADDTITPAKLNSDTPTDGEVLSYNAGAFEWVTQSGGGGGGETNTASNVGTGGVGVYKQKTGVDLEFKNIAAGSNKISVSNDAANNEIDIDVNTANLGLTAADVGLGNVNNTSDANKPVSTATQTALDGKSDTTHTHTLNALSDVNTAGVSTGDVLKYDGSNWVADTDLNGGAGDPSMGGDLSGTASNAQIVAGAVDTTELAAGAVTDAKVASGIAQSKITNLTSDLAGKASTTHTHAASDLTSGTVASARLGSGTADNTTFLRGDGTWAVPAGGGSSAAYDIRGQRTIIVAANDESAAVKAAADYTCDGTADEVQINAALADVGTETINKGGNGGVVMLVGRRFNVAGPILVPTQTTLAGAYGKQGTWIYQSGGYAPGASGGLIECATVDTQYIEVRDLGLHGNNASVCGVYLYTATAQEFDSFHIVKNLYIWNVGQHGLRVENGSGGRLRGNHFSEIRIINPGQNGVYSQGPDSFYERIDVGSAGGHGFACAHSNNRYVNCKAWYSDGSGFYITTGRDNQFSACESQDNAQHGFYIASPRNTLSSCCADSNSYDGSSAGAMTGDNTYDGFYVSGRGTNLHGSASDKNEGGRNVRQRYGVNLVGSPVGVVINVSATDNHATSAQGGTAGASSFVSVAESTL